MTDITGRATEENVTVNRPGWPTLTEMIKNAVYPNNDHQITGLSLQSVLLNMLLSLGEGATFRGIATPTTNPGSPEGPVFYVAFKPGLYPNFSGITNHDNHVLIITNTKSGWVATSLGAINTTRAINSENSAAVAVRRYITKGMFVDKMLNSTAGILGMGGSVTENLECVISDYIRCVPEQAYTVHANMPSGSYTVFFDKDKEPILSIPADTSLREHAFTTPDNCAYFRYCSFINGIELIGAQYTGDEAIPDFYYEELLKGGYENGALKLKFGDEDATEVFKANQSEDSIVEFAKVSKSGRYADLLDKPDIPEPAKQGYKSKITISDLLAITDANDDDLYLVYASGGGSEPWSDSEFEYNGKTCSPGTFFSWVNGSWTPVSNDEVSIAEPVVLDVPQDEIALAFNMNAATSFAHLYGQSLAGLKLFDVITYKRADKALYKKQKFSNDRSSTDTKSVIIPYAHYFAQGVEPNTTFVYKGGLLSDADYKRLMTLKSVNVVNGLTSNSAVDALAAYQGKMLNETKADKACAQLMNVDLDTLKDDGARYFAGSGNGCTNRPSSVEAFYLEVNRSAAGWYTQILFSSTGSDAINKNTAFVRVYDSSMTNWTPWKKQVSVTPGASIGSSVLPVYINSNGELAACDSNIYDYTKVYGTTNGAYHTLFTFTVGEISQWNEHCLSVELWGLHYSNKCHGHLLIYGTDNPGLSFNIKWVGEGVEPKFRLYIDTKKVYVAAYFQQSYVNMVYRINYAALTQVASYYTFNRNDRTVFTTSASFHAESTNQYKPASYSPNRWIRFRLNGGAVSEITHSDDITDTTFSLETDETYGVYVAALINTKGATNALITVNKIGVSWSPYTAPVVYGIDHNASAVYINFGFTDALRSTLKSWSFDSEYIINIIT